MVWTLASFIGTQMAIVACALFAIVESIPALTFEPNLHMCVLTHRGHVAILWAPGIFFELVVFCTTWYNALDRPRKSNVSMTTVLYRDGFSYFTILFCLRIANLVLAVAAPLSLIFLGVFFIWCTTTITITRFILNLRQLAAKEYDRALQGQKVKFSVACVYVAGR
jgi:hypothetical protein